MSLAAPAVAEDGIVTLSSVVPLRTWPSWRRSVVAATDELGRQRQGLLAFSLSLSWRVPSVVRTIAADFSAACTVLSAAVVVVVSPRPAGTTSTAGGGVADLARGLADTDREVGGQATVAVRDRGQRQRRGIRAEDAVGGVGRVRGRRAAFLVRRVGREHLVVHRVGEEHLRRELERHRRAVVDADLEVDVHGTTRVPAGIDRLERHEPVGIARLVAAQPVLAGGVVRRLVGVEPRRVGVPDVDGHALDRRAVCRRR